MSAKATCDEHWSRFWDEDVAQGVEKKLHSWQQLETQCGEEPLYRVRLANLLIQAEHIDDAEQVLLLALKKNPEDRIHVLTSLGNVALSREDSGEAKLYFNKVVSEFPDKTDGYTALAGVELAEGRYDEVVRLCRKALSIEYYPPAGLYLTAAHYGLGDHENVIDVVNKIFAVDAAIAGNSDMMRMLAVSYAEIGEIDKAKGAMATLITHNPNAKHTRGFINTIEFIAKKYDESQD